MRSTLDGCVLGVMKLGAIHNFHHFHESTENTSFHTRSPLPQEYKISTENDDDFSS